MSNLEKSINKMTGRGTEISVSTLFFEFFKEAGG